jgi:hypothetical protein
MVIALCRAVGALAAPSTRRVVALSLGLGVVIFAVLCLAIAAILYHTAFFEWRALNWLVDVLSGLGVSSRSADERRARRWPTTYAAATAIRPSREKSFLAQTLVILDGVAGVAVMRCRPASEIGRQLTAFVLQALLPGGEMKIHASSPPQPPGRFCPVGSHTIASIKGVPADGRIQDGARRRVIANASAARARPSRASAPKIHQPTYSQKIACHTRCWADRRSTLPTR